MTHPSSSNFSSIRRSLSSIADWTARVEAVVALSPHYDDCVMSCYGALVATGARVATVFAGQPPPGAELTAWDRLCGGTSVEALHGARVRENAEALGRAGLEAIDLPFYDGQYRGGDDDALAAEVATAVAQLKADAIMAPAGIGGHRDHLVVREAADRLGLPTLWYADVPYAVMYGWPAGVTAGTDVPVEVDWEQFLTVEGTRDWQAIALPENTTRRKLDAVATYKTQVGVLNARFGNRLSDPETMRIEVYWAKRPW